MAEIDAQAYAVTSGNAAAGASNSVETQQPGGSGALRQVMVIGDPTTRGNMATVGANGQLYTQGYQPAATTFSAVTATGALTSTSAAGLNIATVTLRTFTGTTPSITFRLEASDDNTNWVVLQGINNTTGQVGTSFTQASALTAGTAGPSIDYTIGAYTNVRINVTAISGATATAAFGLALQTMPYEASPGAVAQGVAASGSTVTGNPVLIGGSDGTNAQSAGMLVSGAASPNSTGNGVLVGGTSYSPTFTFSSVTTGTVYDVGNYAWVSVQINAYYTGTTPTVGFQVSNDNSNWFNMSLIPSTAGQTASVVNATTTGVWHGPLSARYFRLNMTGTYTSGSTTGQLSFSSVPKGIQGIGVAAAQSGTLPWQIRGAASTTSSGMLVAKVLSAANTTPIQVKTTAGAVYGWHLFNNAATVRYVRFFNVSSSPTMGTTSPTFVIPLPASGGAVLPITDMNIPMATGIFYAITTGAADLDNTAGAANDVVGTIWSI